MAKPSKLDSSPRPRPRSIALFFLLAYLIAWALWAPTILKARGVIDWEVPGADTWGLFGSSLAAVITAGLTEGKTGVKAIWGRIFKLRIKLGWYLVPLLLPVLLSGLAVGVEVLLGGGSPVGSVMPLQMAPLYLITQVVTHLLTEEPGWRGYALPKLQERYRPVQASLILGLLWGCWHIPLFLIPGRPQGQMPPLGFLLAVVAATVLMAWVQNRAGSSFVSVLFHASMNTSFAAFAVLTSSTRLFWLTVVIWLAVAVLVAIRTGLRGSDPASVDRAA